MKYASLPPTKQIGDFGFNHQALLGSGSFGKVYYGQILKNKSPVAIKVLSNSQISDPYLQSALQKEVAIMKKLTGDNVVRLIDYLKSSNNTYLIQEFCDGGDLRGYLNKKKKLSEEEAKHVLKNLLNGFRTMIVVDVVHRDLKPENILIHGNIFKLADFGFSTTISNHQNLLKSICGTPLYMSPQILMRENYTSKSDIWSLGLIYYEMLCGKTPWPARSERELLDNTRTVPLKFPYDVKISDQSKDFIKKCLAFHEKDRFSWEQIFMHDIYLKEQIIVKKPDPIINFSPNNAMRRKSTFLLSENALKALTELQEIIQKNGIDLKKVFNNFDKTKDNKLDKKEFTKLINVINNNLNQKDIEEIFGRFDVNGDNSITYEEFYEYLMENDYNKECLKNDLLAKYRGEKLLKHLANIISDNNINVIQIFQKYDTSKNNHLSLEEFHNVVQDIDSQASEQDIIYVFNRFDYNQDGNISLLEFNKVIENNLDNRQARSMSIAQNNLSNVPPVPIVNPITKICLEIKEIINRNNISPQWVFQHFDKSGDSLLDYDEFKYFIQVFNSRYNEAEIKALFQAFDINGDGDISFNEFVKFLN